MNVNPIHEPSKSTDQKHIDDDAAAALIKGRRLSDAEFESAIRFYATQNGGRCPTDKELRAAGDHGLRGEIARRGGLKRAAAQLGIPRTQSHAWTAATAVAAWVAGQQATGVPWPPKSWFEANGYAGALTLLRRVASAEPGHLARMRETAAWVQQHQHSTQAAA